VVTKARPNAAAGICWRWPLTLAHKQRHPPLHLLHLCHAPKGASGAAHVAPSIQRVALSSPEMKIETPMQENLID